MPPEAPDTPAAGPIEAALDEVLADLDVDEVAGGPVYAQMARRLAATLDAGAGLAVAAVNRELRETVKALTGADEGGGGDGASGSAGLLARLSAPLGHTEN